MSRIDIGAPRAFPLASKAYHRASSSVSPILEESLGLEGALLVLLRGGVLGRLLLEEDLWFLLLLLLLLLLLW